MSVLVSICIPTYNRSNSLKRAIKNILSQTYTEVEVLISDNYSTDETSSLCKSLVKEDSRIKYFRQPSNIGPTANFEFIKDKAIGKYFMWHSDDDFIEFDYIEKCVSELERDHSLVLVSGLTGFKEEPLGKIKYYGNTFNINSNFKIFRIVSYLNNVADNSVFYGLYRLSELNGLYMPNMLAGDWIWLVQVLLKGKAKILSNTLMIRTYGDSSSASFERIVSLISAPKWHAKFPYTAIILNFIKFFYNKHFIISIISLIVLTYKTTKNKLVFYLKLKELNFFFKSIKF